MNKLMAHVKWFTGVSPAAPEPILQVLNPVWWLGAALTLVVALLLTRLNVPLQRIPWVQRLHAALTRQQRFAPWIIRVGMAVPLLGAGLGGYLFHYELLPLPAWLATVEIALGLLILFPGADRLAALGVFLVYGAGAGLFGLHRVIDYVIWPGAAYYLASRGSRWEGARIPVLYITAGISLAWAAVEKWVFPTMALDILHRNPIPTFGFPPDLFLMLSGWIELGVGYLLITGVLNRLLSLVVTLLFVLTSSVFGSKEILGHWLLHAALIVFLIEGTGPYVTPVLWHKGNRLQLAFVGVTLIPFVAGLLAAYYLLQ